MLRILTAFWAVAAWNRAEWCILFWPEYLLAHWLHLRAYWHPKEWAQIKATFKFHYEEGIP